MNPRKIYSLLSLAAACALLGACAESQTVDSGAQANAPRAMPAAAGGMKQRPIFDPTVKGVKIWEEQVKIPTYLIGPPDPNPQFYFGGATQGAQERIYPYPSYDILTTERADKPYTMVYLENEYVKIGVLPDNGGRIFESVDKTNGYAFFYNQHVIKPALISLLGAWISGGVEWDLPHHHRATSFVPVQYTLESEPDGSKTCWVGELEIRDRMEWAVGVTLHPGKSYLEGKFRIINRNPVPNSMLCFSNVAVHSNNDYQVIFPPSTQWTTGHSKQSFQNWTMDSGWWRNSNGSAFAWNHVDDFMAGYDFGKHAGLMSVADHNVVAGHKFFTWGPTSREYNMLTDNDGPYLEMMVGAYSDNQPDYSWMTPFETRSWSQFWYPFRDIDGVKCATTEAAVNLDVANGSIRVGFYSTSDRPAANVLLKLKDQTLLQEQIAINPGKAYVKEIPLPAGADMNDLRASLSDGGKELVAYQPVKLTPEPRPSPAGQYPAPAAVTTNDELYIIGLRIDQFRTPYSLNNNNQPTGNTASAYWQEALRRDPGDVRVNTAMGINALKGGRFADAERYCRKALERATQGHTTPKDGEPFYYLGLALKGQGKMDAAFDEFAHATWSGAWRNASFFEMAEIATMKGDVSGALTYVDKSLNAGGDSVRALALKSSLLRHDGKTDEALACAAAIGKVDPLDVRALAERWLATKSAKSAKALADQVNTLPVAGLEVAAEYMNAGLWEDGTAYLNQVVKSAGDPVKVSAMAYYYLGYFAQKMNQPEKAASYYQLAMKTPTDYVFPFQMEMIAVFEAAMAANPKDARAPYYLGNLLFDYQPERAIALWETSAGLGADFPVVYRNLAQVYTRAGGQRDRVLALLEKGAQYGGNAMIFEQLDQLYEENGVAPEKRLEMMTKHQAVVNRPEAISREINLAVAVGKPELAVKLIKSLYFRAWEGRRGYSMGDAWANANIAEGHQQMAAKRYKEALAFYQAALSLPATLAEEGGGSVAGHAVEATYYMGNAYEALGDMTAARQAWTSASTGNVATGGGGLGGSGRGAAPAGGGGTAGSGGGTTIALPTGQFGSGGRGGGGNNAGAGTNVRGAVTYYQALAMQKLGNDAQATSLFTDLIARAEQAAATPQNAVPENPATLSLSQRGVIADLHYLMALGNLGLGNKDKAKEEFAVALKVSPGHVATKMTMAQMNQ